MEETKPEQQASQQASLPDDWRENTGSNYERLTGERGSIICSIIDVRKEYNSKFKRPEYQWRIYKVLPSGILTEKIMTESSKRFCSALSEIDRKHPVVGTDQVLKIEWEKTRDNKGKEAKEWKITLISPDQFKQILSSQN